MSSRRKLVLLSVVLSICVVALVVLVFLPSTRTGQVLPSVVVTQAREEQASPAAAKCPVQDSPSSPSRIACIGNLAADTGDPSKALDLISRIVEEEPRLKPSCHSMEHTVGQRLATELPLASVLSFASERCTGGFIHGMLEGLALSTTDAEFEAVYPHLCDRFEQGSGLRVECSHGLGHAVALHYKGELASTISRCDAVSIEDVGSCGGAVIMAYTNDSASLGENLTVSLKKPEVKDLPQVCNSVKEHSRACWNALWQFYPATMPADDLVAALSLQCPLASTTELRTACAEAVGGAIFHRKSQRPVSGPALHDEVITLFRSCPQSVDQSGCAAGLSSAAALWWRTFEQSFDLYKNPCPELGESVVVACSAMYEEWRSFSEKAQNEDPLFTASVG